jgi:hypothetical protein
VQWPNLVGDLVVVGAAICAAFVALFVYVLWRGGWRPPEDEGVRRSPAASWIAQVAGIVFLLALGGGAITFFVYAARHNRDLGTGGMPPGGSEGMGLDPGAAGPGAPFVVHWWVIAGLGFIAVAVVALLVVGRRRGATGMRTEGAEPRSESRERIRAAVEDSLEEIAREADPRRAVIRAYVRMEQILARHGLGRFSHEAPVEYLNRALTGIQVSRSAAERLTALFVRARFSHHTVDTELKGEAIAALTAMRDELEVARP